MKSGDLERVIDSCRASHRRLELTVGALTDATARQPSLLAGWSVGHLVTHLARNADSHVRILEASERGSIAEQYVGGAAGRAAEIEAGAHRGAAELIADLSHSQARLELVWSVTTERGWSGHGIALGGELPNHVLAYRRWVESEIHHVDLGDIGGSLEPYTFARMPTEFVGLELRRLTASWASRQPMGLTGLPPVALALTAPDRLAWLTGRLVVDGLAPADVFG